jgi:hypothetical protein
MKESIYSLAGGGMNYFYFLPRLPLLFFVLFSFFHSLTHAQKQKGKKRSKRRKSVAGFVTPLTADCARIKQQQQQIGATSKTVTFFLTGDQHFVFAALFFVIK